MNSFSKKILFIFLLSFLVYSCAKSDEKINKKLDGEWQLTLYIDSTDVIQTFSLGQSPYAFTFKKTKKDNIGTFTYTTPDTTVAGDYEITSSYFLNLYQTGPVVDTKIFEIIKLPKKNMKLLDSTGKVYEYTKK